MKAKADLRPPKSKATEDIWCNTCSNYMFPYKGNCCRCGKPLKIQNNAITTIGQLKARIKKYQWTERQDFDFALKLINSFEASVRERLREYTTGDTPEDGLLARDFRTIANELRRILGEGASP